MRDEFISTIRSNQSAFELELADPAIDRLADYYELILEHNPLLHLVAPCSPEEFATRHILESLTLLEFLPNGARFADVGTGAGLPSVPCLIVSADLKAILIESKKKKTKFLETAILQLGIADRVEIVNHQFEEANPGNAQFIACRALDKFTEKLPKLINWSKGRPMFLFGGENLEDGLRKAGKKPKRILMPLSDQRYLFAFEG